MTKSITDTSSLVLYSLPNYAGTATTVDHGDTGIIATSASVWNERSLSISDSDEMCAFIWSSVDTGNPAQSYTGHTEQYISASIPDLMEAYPSPQYSLQYLGLDSALAVPVMVQADSTFTGQNCFASTSVVYGSATSVTTLVLPGSSGAMAFIGPMNGASALATLMTGTFDSITGLVTWQSSASVMLVYTDGLVTLSSVTDLPDGWSFGTPVQQDDGSWLISLTSGTEADSGTLWSGANYTGSSQSLLPHDSMQANSGAGWLWQSLKLKDMATLLYSSFNPVNTAFDYTNYQLYRMISDTPDFSAVFSGATPVQLLALDSTDIQLNVQLSTTAADDAVLVLTQAYPLAFYSAIVRDNNGLLAVLPADGTVESLNVQYGTLNADGTASLTTSATLDVAFSNGIPVITPGADIPSAWTFSTPVQQDDGSWLSTLTESSLPTTAEISTLVSDKSSINNDGTDSATITATVSDSATGLVLPGVTVSWNSTLGTLNATSSVTADDGTAQVTLTDAGDTGSAIVMARIDTGSSKSTVITIQAGSTAFAIIRGARTANSLSGRTQTSRLVALDASTFLPTIVVWRYQNSSQYSASSEFLDTSPNQYLEISNLNGDVITLNPANILGNGVLNDAGAVSGAFAARLDTGNYVGWGMLSDGGFTLPAEINYGIQAMMASSYSFTALRDDMSLFSWGDASEGGETPVDIALLKTFVDVKATLGTFAARSLVSPYIQSWGWGTDDTEAFSLSVPDDIAQMSDINKIIANENAFAVINEGGEAFAWGSSTTGGTTTKAIQALSGITECGASRRAFAVIADGKIYAWGDKDYGADASAVSSITNAVRLVATESAFAALTSAGSVVCWGNETYGNSLPDDIASRTDIVDVKASYGAFAALCRDGSVVCWGNETYGSDNSQVDALLLDVIALSATAGSFAALTRTGRVICWGDTTTGGSNALYSDLQNVSAVYSNTRAFAALKEDKTVTVWGDAPSGVLDYPADLIDGNISYTL